MVTVHLRDVVLFGYHGIYAHERQNGNTFEVTLDATYDEGERSFDDIQQTISYESLFVIVSEEMENPTSLLEKLAATIIARIHNEYSFVREVGISIYKLKAPIPSFSGKAGITIRKTFS